MARVSKDHQPDGDNPGDAKSPPDLQAALQAMMPKLVRAMARHTDRFLCNLYITGMTIKEAGDMASAKDMTEVRKLVQDMLRRRYGGAQGVKLSEVDHQPYLLVVRNRNGVEHETIKPTETFKVHSNGGTYEVKVGHSDRTNAVLYMLTKVVP